MGHFGEAKSDTHIHLPETAEADRQERQSEAEMKAEAVRTG